MRFNYSDKLLILFFIYILINGVYNNFFEINESNISQNKIFFKSLSFLRFLIFYFIVKFLILKGIINYKYLFFSFGAVSLFVCFDLMVQFSLGYDLFGFEKTGRRLTGPFNDEYIAGSFLQRFSFFALCYSMFFIKFKKKNIFNLQIFFTLLVLLIGFILAGNRIPLLMFLIGVFLTFIFFSNIRKIFFIFFFLIPISLSIFMKSTDDYHSHYVGFVEKTYQITNFYHKKMKGESPKPNNSHLKEIESGYATWKLNKYFGGGIKSFYNNCLKLDKKISKDWGHGNFKVNNCPNHPHNYFIQLLAELGIFGFSLILLYFFSIIYNSFTIIANKEESRDRKNFIIFFLIIFLIEIFPFKTTGSFFTSLNASYIFFVIAFIAGLSQNRNFIIK